MFLDKEVSNMTFANQCYEANVNQNIPCHINR